MNRHNVAALAALISLGVVACAGVSPLARYQASPDYDPARFDEGFHVRTVGEFRLSAPHQAVRLEIADPLLRDSVLDIVGKTSIKRAEDGSAAPKLEVRTGYLVQNNAFGIDGHQGLAMSLADALKNDFSFNDLRPLRCDKKPVDGTVGEGLRANAGNIVLWLSTVVGGPMLQAGVAATGAQTAAAKRPGQIDPCQQITYYLPDSSASFKETITTEFRLELGGGELVSRTVTTIRNRKGHEPKEVLEQHKRDLSLAFLPPQ